MTVADVMLGIIIAAFLILLLLLGGVVVKVIHLMWKGS